MSLNSRGELLTLISFRSKLACAPKAAMYAPAIEFNKKTCAAAYLLFAFIGMQKSGKAG
jgi:chemotaxis signal transduction protein